MESTSSGVKPVVLLIDKNNFIAKGLAEKLSKEATVVLVSQENIQSDKDIISVAYVSPLPQIPDGIYSAMIFVWEEKHSHLVDPLIKKAKEQNSRFFIIASEVQEESLPKDLPDVTILVLGDLLDTEEKFPLTEFLLDAKTKKRLRLANMGLHEWYPVLLSDAVAKIEELVTGTKYVTGTYFVGPKHPYTALTLAHSIQKVDPDIIVDFSRERDEYAPKREKHSVFSQYDSVEKVQTAYRMITVKQKDKTKEIGQVVFAKQKQKKKKFSWWLYVTYLFFLGIFLPIITALIGGGAGALLLTSGIDDAKKGLSINALAKIQAAEQNFSLSQSSFSIVAMESQLVGQQGTVNSIRQKIAAAQKLTQIASGSIRFTQSLTNILQGKTLSPETEEESAVADLQEVEVLLQGLSPEDVPAQYRQSLGDTQKLNTILSGISATLPQILGVTTTKTYLVLFQNNMELRPGGGFIGSYGLLKLQHGAIREFSIHDVYDADGQLKGHIEPPFALRRYMPIVHLYLRDSNFDPDFTKDGQTAAFILSQETGERVDGVIGIDLFTLKTLLSSSGSVYVPSYNQTVTKDNFFTLLEEHAEKNFFPGSTQKKDFLRAFATSLLAKLQGKVSVDIFTLLSQTVGLLQGKHVMVSFASSAIQPPFTIAGLSDSLLDTRAIASSVMNDFMGVVEANLGVNKANAYVTRSVQQNVIVDEKGNLNENITLQLHNSSDGTWPGGVYRNYIRFILPANAVIQNISLNNVDQHIIPAVTDPKVYEAKSFIAPKGLEVAKESEVGRQLYGFLVTVPVESTLSIKISYAVQNAFQLSLQKQVYDLLVWKQPGVDNFPHELHFTLPKNYTMLSSNVPSVKDGQTVVVKSDLDKDTDYTVSFSAQ